LALRVPAPIAHHASRNRYLLEARSALANFRLQAVSRHRQHPLMVVLGGFADIS
jgi:hypothetical protein